MPRLSRTNHYDVDGLMSLWAMLKPEAALGRAEPLVAVGVSVG